MDNPTTPRLFILQYFAQGGKVSLKDAKHRTGLSARNLLGFVSHRGISYDRLIERAQEYTFETDAATLANEIDEIISGGKRRVWDELKGNDTRGDSFKELVERLNLGDYL